MYSGSCARDQCKKIKMDPSQQVNYHWVELKKRYVSQASNQWVEFLASLAIFSEFAGNYYSARNYHRMLCDIFLHAWYLFFSIPDFSALSSGHFPKSSGKPYLHFNSVVCLSTWWLFFQLSAWEKLMSNHSQCTASASVILLLPFSSDNSWWELHKNKFKYVFEFCL